MATCQDIIRRALRSLGILGSGQEPTGADADDGLERLQSLVLGLPGLNMNGLWHDHATSTAGTVARESQRLTVTAPGTVTLPLVITHCERPRPPRDLAKVQIIGTGLDNAGFWIYSATKSLWGQLDGLEISSELPFGDEDSEGLAAMLAVNMGDEFGATATITQRTNNLAATAARSFRARFKKYDHDHEHRRHDGLLYGDYATWA